MDFEDSPEESTFRAKVRMWIDANAPKHLEDELRRTSTIGRLGITSEDPVVASKNWQAKKAVAGYACLQWPVEYGGGGLSAIERVIWQQEEGPYAQLSLMFSIGYGMCGPTLMTWASHETNRRLLPPMATGEEVWCQLFSEPAAGSDLAGLRTRAELADDGSGDWIVNGQKVWTSFAQHARYGMLIARTDPGAPKHKGLTMFFVDMQSPGIEVRPIKQANGQATFNEVFFTDLRVPDANRLGAVGQGWEVSITMLMNERATIGANISTSFEQIFDFVEELETIDGPAIEDRAVRSKLAHWAARASGLKYTAMRSISALSRGETPGPENSIGKLVIATMRQEIAAFALDLQGPAGILDAPDYAPARGWFQANLLRSPAMRIEGGSDEILRNVIGERVLGLPADIRIDKNVPFNEIPTKGAVR
ncbi:MAG: acyl-CoA dehydrogenase [Novosphingobium sp.]|nr:MAG: acyl-CoA dehydrogenase [Novosphingobium sp.]